MKRELSFPLTDFPAPENLIEAYAQDIDYLHFVFGKLNRSFTPATRSLFETRLQALRKRVDALTHGEFVMGIAKAIAAADDGHTRVLFRRHLSFAPIRFHWFSDGLYIVQTRVRHRELLCAKVVRFGESTPESLVQTLTSYIGGTIEHVSVASAELMRSPDALHGIGVLSDSMQLPLSLILANGDEVSLSLDAEQSNEPRHWYRRPRNNVPVMPISQPEWCHVLENTVQPRYLQDCDDNVLDVMIHQLNSFYVRINVMTNLVNRDLDDYLDEVLTKVRNTSPKHVIVDLRLNPGGNYMLAHAFAKQLPGLLGKNGRLFVLTSHYTFSAALVTVALLKYYAKGRALIIGQRMGDREQFWAEGGVIELPNSQLPVCLTDGFHNWKEGGMNEAEHCPWFNQLYGVAAGSLAPDIEIESSFATYLTGQDSFMNEVERIITQD